MLTLTRVCIEMGKHDIATEAKRWKMNFNDDVLKVLRTNMKHRISIPGSPKNPSWVAIDKGAEGVTLDVTADQSLLCKNFQKDAAATPFFALCIAWWFEKFTGRKTEVVFHVPDETPQVRGQLLHWRRTHFLLSELTSLIPLRFVVKSRHRWEWPPDPRLNIPRGERATSFRPEDLRERAIGSRIARYEGGPGLFPVKLSSIQEQLPLGLFNEKVSRATAWTAGGASQIDLWGASLDGKTFHLFELKRKGNQPVGIIPEALFYLRMLHYLRVGKIKATENNVAHNAIMSADKLVMWLAAPGYHPLVYHNGETPLAWLKEGMDSQQTELRILPIDTSEDPPRFWKTAEAWPPM